jgi:hypothetical protein
MDHSQPMQNRFPAPEKFELPEPNFAEGSNPEVQL